MVIKDEMSEGVTFHIPKDIYNNKPLMEKIERLMNRISWVITNDRVKLKKTKKRLDNNE